MKSGKVLLCCFFNIHPIVSPTVLALVMDIITIYCSFFLCLITTVGTFKISTFLVSSYDTHTMTFWTLYLYTCSKSTIYAMGKIRFVFDSFHGFLHPLSVFRICYNLNLICFKSLALIVRSKTLFSISDMVLIYSCDACIRVRYFRYRSN